jgi:hypothetical protein
MCGTEPKEGKYGFQYWDSHITFETSYLARLNYFTIIRYVTELAENYRWCSAAWFAQHAKASFVSTVRSFKIHWSEETKRCHWNYLVGPGSVSATLGANMAFHPGFLINNSKYRRLFYNELAWTKAKAVGQRNARKRWLTKARSSSSGTLHASSSKRRH